MLFTRYHKNKSLKFKTKDLFNKPFSKKSTKRKYKWYKEVTILLCYAIVVKESFHWLLHGWIQHVGTVCTICWVMLDDV